MWFISKMKPKTLGGWLVVKRKGNESYVIFEQTLMRDLENIRLNIKDFFQYICEFLNLVAYHSFKKHWCKMLIELKYHKSNFTQPVKYD